MRRGIVIAALVVTGLAGAVGSARAETKQGTDGLVYRYYASAGYQLNPLLSFAGLNREVTARHVQATRRLAAALLAHGVRRGGALYWQYDFSFGGGPRPWTSGFTQVVAAQALARAGVLLRDPMLLLAADASFRALQSGLVLRVGGGAWIREYGYTRQVILNAQLQSLLSLESYAEIAQSPAVDRLVAQMKRATLTLLPRFDLGCWGRYQLDGYRADAHYEAYHVELLRRLAATHDEPIWRDTYTRWASCLR